MRHRQFTLARPTTRRVAALALCAALLAVATAAIAMIYHRDTKVSHDGAPPMIGRFIITPGGGCFVAAANATTECPEQ